MSQENTLVNVTETARPLLTPDECMRLPWPEKDSQGKVVKPGDMLVFTAGQSPIYGRQILYFFDPFFCPFKDSGSRPYSAISKWHY